MLSSSRSPSWCSIHQVSNYQRILCNTVSRARNRNGVSSCCCYCRVCTRWWLLHYACEHSICRCRCRWSRFNDHWLILYLIYQCDILGIKLMVDLATQTAIPVWFLLEVPWTRWTHWSLSSTGDSLLPKRFASLRVLSIQWSLPRLILRPASPFYSIHHSVQQTPPTAHAPMFTGVRGVSPSANWLLTWQ